MKGRNDIISVGIDLHTTQFTVCALVDNNMIIQEAVYPTTEEGYRSFIEWAHKAEEEFKCGVSIAVGATGNSRYFRNTMEFKVIIKIREEHKAGKCMIQPSSKKLWD